MFTMNNINYHISNLIECWLDRNFRQMKFFLKQEIVKTNQLQKLSKEKQVIPKEGRKKEAKEIRTDIMKQKKIYNHKATECS